VNDKIFELMMLRVNDMVKQASIKLQSWNRMYGCFSLYDDALNLLDNLDCSSKENRSRLKTRKKEISNKISESKKIIKPVEKEIAKEFNKSNFPSTSGYCNKIREEYPTLKDVMWASFSELKDVYGMGGTSESDLKNFIIEKGEELNKILRNN
jgi:ERCC4-type nuclease